MHCGSTPLFFVGGNLATVKGVINGQATHGLEAATLVAWWGFEWLMCSGCGRSPAAGVLTVGAIKPTFDSAPCIGASDSCAKYC